VTRTTAVIIAGASVAALVIAGADGAALGAAAPPQTFHASTDAVSLDVAVFDGDRVVPRLSAGDFEVFDNGVRQTISTADRNSLPIDLRLVFDTSDSITPAALEKYRRAMNRVAESLKPADTAEILTFGTHIGLAAPRQHPPVRIELARAGSSGTSFFDAVSLAMITKRTLERRQITIVLSDAVDNASFFDETALYDAARRTDAVVYAVLPAEIPADAAPLTTRLRMLTLLTGGRLVQASRDGPMGQAIIDALEEFRQSYVLRYVISGVPIPGWHALTVRVRGAKYTIRAREGYFGR